MMYGNYPNLNGVKRILVVKLRHLGDVLLSAPVFSHLKRVFPDAQIDAYIWKEAEPMLSGHSAISQLILYDRKWKSLSFPKRIVKEGQLLRQIRQQNYDLIVNLTEGDRGALAAFVSEASVKVGFDPGKKGMIGKRKIFSHLVKSCPNPRHTVERDLDALRRIGIFPSPQERSIELSIPEEAKLAAKKMLGGLQKGEFTLIHPVSRWRFKCCPPQLMAQVIDELEGPVVLTSGPAEQEREMLREIARYAKKEVIDLGEKLLLRN